MIVLLRTCLTARRTELLLVAAVIVLAVLVWPAKAPEGLIAPGMPRDNLLVLVAGVLGPMVVAAVDLPQRHLLALAVVSVRLLAIAVGMVVLGYALGLTVLAALFMEPEVAGQFVRNAVLMTGASLLAVSVIGMGGHVVSPLWAALSVVVGRAAVPGGPPVIRGWAIPVLPDGEATWIAGALLLLGLAALGWRGPSKGRSE